MSAGQLPVGYGVGDFIRKPPSSITDPAQIALTFEGREVSFGELDRRTDRLGAALLDRGFRKGERIGVMSHNSVGFVETFLAAAKIGGVVVPINYLLRPAEVDYALRDSGAAWLFVDGVGREVAGEILDRHPDLELVEFEGKGGRGHRYEELIAAAPEAEIDPGLVAPGDLLLLQYTSGTTGFPKGAMHTHSTVTYNAMYQIPDWRLTREDVYICSPALCWASGFHNLTLPLFWLGGKVALQPSTGFDPDELCAAIEREGGTILAVVPSVLRRLLGSGALERHDLSSLRVIAAGGESVEPKLLERLRELLPGAQIAQAFGMSEFPTVMALTRTTEEALERPGTTGRATSLAMLRVVDEEGVDAPPGEHGEIICRSPASMVGYWEKPEATAAAIRDGWLWTGDRGYLDAEGYLFIAGRSKEMYISGGLNVYPAEIEVVLLQNPEVEEAAVTGVAHPEFGETGCGFVLPRAGSDLGAEELTAFCRERLATYKVPKHWVLRDEPLPRTASGKIQKHRLEVPAGDGGAVR